MCYAFIAIKQSNLCLNKVGLVLHLLVHNTPSLQSFRCCTIAVNVNLKIHAQLLIVLPWQSYGTSPAMGTHSVTCPPTQVNAPRLNISQKDGTRFTYPGGMEGWVDLGYLAMHRSGVELAIYRSQVRRPNHYTTEPSSSIDTVLRFLTTFVISVNVE